MTKQPTNKHSTTNKTPEKQKKKHNKAHYNKTLHNKTQRKTDHSKTQQNTANGTAKHITSQYNKTQQHNKAHHNKTRHGTKQTTKTQLRTRLLIVWHSLTAHFSVPRKVLCLQQMLSFYQPCYFNPCISRDSSKEVRRTIIRTKDTAIL